MRSPLRRGSVMLAVTGSFAIVLSIAGEGVPTGATTAKPQMLCRDALPAAKPQSGRAPDNAVAYLTAAGHLQRDFSLSADLTLEKTPANRGLFYADWIILGEQAAGDVPFVQVNLIRWKRYGYRSEIAYTWMGPDGKLIFQDSRIFLDDRPHRFFVGARGDRISVTLDIREICRASKSRLFGNATLGYQLGGEVMHYGDSIRGTASNIRFKSDTDAQPKIHHFRCEWVDRGIRWIKTGSDSFRLAGTESKSAMTGVAPVIPNGCGPRA